MSINVELPILQEMEAVTHALQKALGKENVAFDLISRLLYSTDASNYQIVPIGVTFPRDSDDVCAIHEVANQYNVPLLPRGAGTSLSGQTVGRAVVMDFSRHMRRITSVNAETKTIQVEPGLVLEQMNNQLKGLNLMFGPDPASANRATIGGCLGNNASGTHSIVYGMTADHVHWVDVVLTSGEKVRLGKRELTTQNATTQAIYDTVAQVLHDYGEFIATRYPKTWRNVAGYALNKLDPANIDLAQLMVGSEGSLATIVGAELALVERPKRTGLVILHFESLRDSLEIVPLLLETQPSAVELLDRLLIERTRHQPEFAKKMHFVVGNPAAILVIEYYGESENEIKGKITGLKAVLRKMRYAGAILDLLDTPSQANVWYIRKAGLGLLASNRSDWKTVALIEDAAVPVEHLADYIDMVMDIVRGEGADLSVYAHASAGCLHVRPLLNLKTEEGLRQYRAIAEAAFEAVMRFNGTISGEHGQGLLRSEFTARLFGEELWQAFLIVKKQLDPHNHLNQNKTLQRNILDNIPTLRYNPQESNIPQKTQTYYNWKHENGFLNAIEMCNGAGICRKEESGTMCPSFMATRNEQDSTRGRANILRLAISGKYNLQDTLEQKALEVLDLCLSCKACKAECPSSVDMARIKAEFSAQYYKNHPIPIRSRLFSTIHLINRVGSAVPRLFNFLIQFPILSLIVKSILGISLQHQLPTLAQKRFSRWYKKQTNTHTENPNIPILIIDTFTEYNNPHLGKALHYLLSTTQTPLQAIRLPNQGCCGRPAISKGNLSLAKTLAHNNLSLLNKIVQENPNVQFMLLEPSCVSAIADDMPDLVDPHLRDTAKIIASKTISVETWLYEFMLQKKDVFSWDHIERRLILHGHCHQKALWGTVESCRLLEMIPNAKVEELDAGCCGMAGSFGYEQEHYHISAKIAEQRLWQAIRNNPNAIIVASGTSCREQIQHIQGKTYHPVEVVAMACGWKRND